MKTVITIISILISCSLWAQQDSLSRYKEEGTANNPGILSKGLQYESAKEKKLQETTLPNLDFSAGVFLKPMVLPMGNQVAQLSAMQMFPWFGTYSSIRAEAEAMEQVAEEQFLLERNQVWLQTNVSWFSLYNLKMKKSLKEGQLSLLAAVENFLITQYASSGKGKSNTSSPKGMSGAASSSMGMSTLLRLKMEIKDLQNQLLIIDDEFRTEQTRFNLLLNRDRNATIDLPDTLVALPFSMLTEETQFSNNPMVRMIEAEKRAAEASEQMAIKMGAPMIGAGLNYMVMTKPTSGDFPMADGKDMIMPMVSLSLPIYRKKYTSLKKEAQLNQSALGKQIEQVRNDLMVEYQEALQMKTIAMRNLKLAQEQTALAENTVALLLTEYAANQSGYEEVLRMKSLVLMYKIDSIEALTAYNTAIAKLEFILNSY